MRFRGVAGLSCLVSLLILGALIAGPAAARVSTYKGQFQCDDRGVVTPLAGMNVELWERGSPDFLPVEIVGHRVDQDFTAADGSFATDDARTTTTTTSCGWRCATPTASTCATSGESTTGRSTPGSDATTCRSRTTAACVFSTPGQSHKCAIWAGVHAAHERYREEIGAGRAAAGGRTAGRRGHRRHAVHPRHLDPLAGRLPGRLRRPGGDDSITRHEFGHVIRHGFDGDFGHFLGDVVTYNYLQNHEPCNHTNGGYAFNEGWAEFWAPDFRPAPDCGRPGDMETEGNVAAALTDLMENCAGGKRKPMVETLQRNPGTIHSFSEFRDRLGCPFPKLFPVTVASVTLAPPNRRSPPRHCARRSPAAKSSPAPKTSKACRNR